MGHNIGIARGCRVTKKFLSNFLGREMNLVKCARVI